MGNRELQFLSHYIKSEVLSPHQSLALILKPETPFPSLEKRSVMKVLNLEEETGHGLSTDVSNQ